MAVILRFKGDPEDLLARFEGAREASSQAQDDGQNPPLFFAICRAEDGVVLVSGWETEEDHKTFRKQMMPHLHAAGVNRPVEHEQLSIARLG